MKAGNASEGSENDAADTSNEDLFYLTGIKKVKESSEIQVGNLLLVNFSGNPKSRKLYFGQVDLPFGSTAFQGTSVKNKSRRVGDVTLFVYSDETDTCMFEFESIIGRVDSPQVL